MFGSLLPIYANLATVVQRAGRVYPTALERHDAALAEGLVEVSTEPLWIDPKLRAAGQQHLRSVSRRSPQMHDGRVLACIAAHGFPIRFASAGYFDAIATSDSLRAEYIQNRERESTSPADLSTLPLRMLAHKASQGDALRSGRGRVAAIGVSVVVTLPSDSGRAFVLGLRNHAVATDPGMWHVAPSGTLEPAHRDHQDPVIGAIVRELAEELGIRLDVAGDLARRLRPLGVGFDLLRLRPEICLRLDLNDDEYPTGGPLLSAQEFQERSLVELSTSSMEAFWKTHPPEALTPAAAAAIALLEHADNAMFTCL